jgi:hypothetical protein
MENHETPDEDQPQAPDESVEEFRRDVEEDPSTAKSPDQATTDAERLRGG